MSVTLRWKENKNGSKTAYLDVYNKGNRKKKYIDIRIEKNDTDKKAKKQLAESIRSKYHSDIINKKFGLVSEDKLQTCFITFFQNFLIGYKKAGRRKYKYAYEKFLTYLVAQSIISKKQKSENPKIDFSEIGKNDGLPFDQLTNIVCRNYKEYLYSSESGLNGETPYDYFVRFRTVVNRAYDEKYLIENPTSKIKLSKPESTLKKQILVEAELQKLAKTICNHSEVKRAFLFACFTGLGEAEIKKLTFRHLADNRLNIERAKNGKKVASALPATAMTLIGQIGKADTKVFRLPSNTAISKHLKNWIEESEIDKHITFYCARHTFAIMNLKRGANLKTISKILGHTTTVPTNKYLNYLDEEKDKAMNNLPELVF